MVNGMGGTPLIELYIVYRKLNEICEEHGITIARNLIGNYITSLEMAGLLHHPAESRRGAVEALGCACEHPRPALGYVTERLREGVYDDHTRQRAGLA